MTADQGALFGDSSDRDADTPREEGEGAPYFVFVDSVERPEATARLKSQGIPYKRRTLDSSYANWMDIAEQLGSPLVIAVIARFTVHHLGFMQAQNAKDWEAPSPRLVSLQEADRLKRDASAILLSALSTKKHIIFVHESLMFPEAAQQELADAPEGEPLDDYLDRAQFYRTYFGDPDPKNASIITQLSEKYHLSFAPYKTNAELGVLTAIFVDENEKNLIFRLYVPLGQLFSDETGRLLELFHDWLTRVKGKRVRREGYKTAEGEIYEFFGDVGNSEVEFRSEVDTFAEFLDACLTDPERAALTLQGTQVDVREIQQVVSRYAKEAKRVQVDVKHSYQQRRLSIRQRLEAELTDLTDLTSVVSEEHLDQLLNAYLPEWDGGGQQYSSTVVPAIFGGNTPSVVNIQVNQNVAGSISQQIAQDLTGVRLGTEATQLMDLISRFAGDEAADLRTSLLELEDKDSKSSNRISAKMKLKAFLGRVGTHVESAAFATLQKYVESKIGIPGA